MSVHKVYIIDAANDESVEVELHDDLTVDVLLDVEEQWAPSRKELRTKLKTLGIGRENWPQSLHWDWTEKSLRLAFGAPEDFRVMCVRGYTAWEAVMVTICKDHFALLSPNIGKPLIYVDYLEVAPWNWAVENVQARRFKAAGAVLLHASIEESYAKGWKGRVGLHALPQATSFYVNQGFQFVKNDADKENLPYYELTAAEAFKRRGRK